VKFKGKIINDWGAVDFSKAEHVVKFKAAMNAFSVPRKRIRS